MEYLFTEDVVHRLAEVLSVNDSKVFEVLKDDLQDLESFLPLYRSARGAPAPTKQIAAAKKFLTAARKKKPSQEELLSKLMDENIDFLVKWKIAEQKAPSAIETYIQAGSAEQDLIILLGDDLDQAIRLVESTVNESENSKESGRGGNRHKPDAYFEYVFRDLLTTYRRATGNEPGYTKDSVNSDSDGKGECVIFAHQCLQVIGITHIERAAIATRIQRVNEKRRKDPDGYDLG